MELHQGLVESFRARVGQGIRAVRTDEVRSNLGIYSYPVIWFEIDREILHDAVAHLISFQFPHLATISGRDLGEELELCYHFSIGYGKRRGEQSVNFRFTVPKSDPRVRSICDLIPGALTAEREKIEFLGVQFEGIPDSRNIFLPYDMKGHPWRRDETGVKGAWL
ncbi:MAG: NADH-quinone oxidoreductase subunit C [Candidatus Bipolaricaulia bacterium]